MADTGFSEACLPSDDEIKAYFYGWKMCHSDGKSPYYKSEIPYNPTTWAEWTKTGLVISSDINGLLANTSATANFIARINTTFKANTKYGVIIDYLENTTTTKYLIALSNLTGSYLTLSSPGVLGKHKLTFTTQAVISENHFDLFFSAVGLDGSIKIKDIRIYELPTGSQIEADFTNLTADQLAIKYPFDGLNTKHWKKLVGTEAEIQASITSTLPTASYEGFTPYKMIYELAEPIEEQHTPVTLPTYYPTTVITTTNDTPAELTTTATVKVEDEE
jgi:hypothetical protein